jgi:hypothetical protein
MRAEQLSFRLAKALQYRHLQDRKSHVRQEPGGALGVDEIKINQLPNNEMAQVEIKQAPVFVLPNRKLRSPHLKDL